MKQGFTQPTSIYVAVGKEGAIMEADCKKLVEILKRKNAKKSKSIFSIPAR